MSEAERSHLAYTEYFLRAAAARGLIGEATRDALLRDVEARRHPAPSVHAPAAPAEVLPAAPQRARPVPSAPARPAPPIPVPPTPAMPRPLPPLPTPAPYHAPVFTRPEPPKWRRDIARWWQRTRESVGSDLAVHGLAYLGVLLLFAGLLGFVIFAFSDISPALRPLAEAAIPTTFVVAAWLLHRRGATLVPRALIGLGAALTPIVVATSFVDDNRYPPDLHGGALQATLATSMLAIAAIYAVLGRRHPGTPLAYAVAPVAWLGIAFAATFTDSNWHGGRDDVVQPLAAQMAITSLAVLATAFITAHWRTGRLSTATAATVLPGFGVVAVLELAAAADEGWPRWPTAVTFLAAAAVLELQHWRMPAQWVGTAQILLAGGAALVELGELRLGWWGLVTTTGAIAVAEFEGWRRPDRTTSGIALMVGAAALLAAATTEPWPMVVTPLVALAWVVARRRWTASWLPVGAVMAMAAATLPVVAAGGLHRAVEPTLATLITAGALLALAAFVRWRRATIDVVWRWWAPIAAAAALLVTAAEQAQQLHQGRIFAAAALATAALLLTPMPARVRVSVGVPTLAWTGYLGLHLGGASTPAMVVALTAAGAVLFAVPVLVRHEAGGVAQLYGTVTLTAALILGAVLELHWPLTLALGLFAGAWAATAVLSELGRSPLEGDLRRRWDVVGALPARARVLAAPATSIASLATLGFVARLLVEPFGLSRTSPGMGLGLVATGLGETAIARLVARHPYPATVAAAVGLSATLLAFGMPDAAMGLIATALAIAAAVIAGTMVRHAEPLWWLAWAEVGVGTAYALDLLDAPRRVDAMTLVTVGSLVAAAALVVDRQLATPGRGLLPVRTAVCRPAAAFGLVALTTGTVLTGPETQGWWGTAALVVAADLVLWALLLDVAVLTGVAWAPATVALCALVPWGPFEHPWSMVLLATTATATAEVVRRTADRSAHVGRWSLPSVVAAHLVAATGLIATGPYGSVAATYLGAAALALAVALLYRHWAWVAAAFVLADVGAADLHPRWLALGFAVESALVTGAAAASRGPRRVGLRVLGVGLAGAAWFTLLCAVDWALRTEMATTAIGGAALVLALVLAHRFARLAAEWVWPWAASGVLAVGATALLSATLVARGDDAAVWPQPFAGHLAIALTLLAVAAGLAAEWMHAPMLRPTSAALTGAAWSSLLCWTTWATTTELATTAIGGAALVLALVLAHRVARLPMAWVVPWAATGVAAVGISAASCAPVWPQPFAGHLAIALALLALAAALGAEPLHAPWLRPASAALTGGAWASLLCWTTWATTTELATTAIGGGALMLLAALAIRLGRLSPEWVWSAATLGAAAMAATVVVAGNESTAVWPRPFAGWFAIALALLALAAAVAARPVAWWLRHVSVVVGAGALGSLWVQFEPSRAVVVLVATLVGGAALLASMLRWTHAPHAPWIGPFLLAAGIANAIALAVAIADLPHRHLLVPVLVVLAVEAATCGVVREQLTLLLTAPVLLYAAWVVFASGAMLGDPQWYTVPVGATLLLDTSLVRRMQPVEWATRTRPAVNGTEYVGMAFVTGASLFRTLVDHPLYGLIAVALGSALAVWGAVTRVRRRAWFGVIAVALAVALMIIVPIATFVGERPHFFEGATLWLVIAGVGLVALVVATMLEQGRVRVRRAVAKLRELTRDWE